MTTLPLLLCVRDRDIVSFVFMQLVIELKDPSQGGTSSVYPPLPPNNCHIPFTAENLKKWSLYAIDITSNSSGCYIGTKIFLQLSSASPAILYSSLMLGSYYCRHRLHTERIYNKQYLTNNFTYKLLRRYPLIALSRLFYVPWFLGVIE